MLYDCIPEFCHVFLCEGAPQLAVFIIDVSVKTHLPADAFTKLNEPAEDVVEVFGDPAPACAVGLVSGKSASRVFILLKLSKLIGIDRFALEAEFLNVELSVLVQQLSLPLQIRDDQRGRGLIVELGVKEHHIAELGGEFAAERGGEHRIRPGLVILDELGLENVHEISFFFIELVVLIHVAADERYLDHCFDMPAHLFAFKKYRARFSVALCVRKPFGQLAVFRPDLFGVGARIGYFGKLHCTAPFVSVYGSHQIPIYQYDYSTPSLPCKHNHSHNNKSTPVGAFVVVNGQKVHFSRVNVQKVHLQISSPNRNLSMFKSHKLQGFYR